MVEKIIWTKKSLADLKVIYDYINTNSHHYAKLTIQQIIAKAELIKNSAFAGRIVPEFNNPSLREFFHKDFRIIYRISTNIIYIVRVYHASRLLRKL